TIRKHSQLLQSTNTSQQQFKRWTPLHINEGQSSYAQEQLWVDEYVRYHAIEKTQKRGAINNQPQVKEIVCGKISIKRLINALQLIVKKHAVLRTSLNYDEEKQLLKQTIEPLTTMNYSFRISSISNDEGEDEQLMRIFVEEVRSTDCFDLEQGQAFRCHIVRRRKNEELRENDDTLVKGDLIVLNTHHAAFDGRSIETLINDLRQSYLFGELEELDLNYIDYSYYERHMDMSDARKYWKNLLDGYDINRQRLKLP
ncbi:unnamed protein product, partial [Rotaria sp. Silwood1]